MTHLLPLLSALNREDCDVHLLCLGDGRLAEEAACRQLFVAVLPMASAWDPSVLVPVRRVISRGPLGFAGFISGDAPRPKGEIDAGEAEADSREPTRWDVVHTHGMRANLPARLAVHALRGRPCLFTTVHSDMRLDFPASGRRLRGSRPNQFVIR